MLKPSQIKYWFWKISMRLLANSLFFNTQHMKNAFFQLLSLLLRPRTKVIQIQDRRFKKNALEIFKMYPHFPLFWVYLGLVLVSRIMSGYIETSSSQ